MSWKLTCGEVAYARAQFLSPWAGPICHHGAMNPVAAPEAAPVAPARPRRSLAALAEKPAGGLAARILGEDQGERLVVSGFNSGI